MMIVNLVLIARNVVMRSASLDILKTICNWSIKIWPHFFHTLCWLLSDCWLWKEEWFMKRFASLGHSPASKISCKECPSTCPQIILVFHPPGISNGSLPKYAPIFHPQGSSKTQFSTQQSSPHTSRHFPSLNTGKRDTWLLVNHVFCTFNWVLVCGAFLTKKCLTTHS